MAQDERLREALLELEVLRKREAASLRDTNALLNVSEEISQASDFSTAYAALFSHLQTYLNADAIARTALVGDSQYVQIDRSNDASLLNCEVPLVIKGKKSRNIVKLSGVPTWQRAANETLSRFESLLILPVEFADSDIQYILAFSKKQAAFQNAQVGTANRMCDLAAQTIKSLALRERNQLLAAVIDGSSSGFSIADARIKEKPLIFVNAAFEDVTGYSAEEAIGENCRFLNAEPEGSKERLRLAKSVRENTGGQFLVKNKRKDGSMFWNSLTLYPVKDEAGQVQHLVATQTDATTEVEARAQQDKMRRQMDDALTHMVDAFAFFDNELRVAYANDAAKDYFPAPGFEWTEGTTFQENWNAYLGQLPKSLMPAEETFLAPDLKRMARSEKAQEFALPNGRMVLARTSETGEGGIVMSLTDVTPIKTVERLLQQRVAAIEKSPDGMGITDKAGRMTYVNAALQDLLLPQGGALVGRKWDVFYKSVVGKSVTDAFRREVEVNGLAEAQWAVNREGVGQVHHDITLTTTNTGEQILIVRDVTTQIQAQRRRRELNEQLQQAKQREALSELAAGLAHDFNNLLSAINGSAALIALDAQKGSKTITHAERITAAGTQAAKLINRLLDLGGTADDQGEFDLNLATQASQDLIRGNLPPNIDFSLDTTSEPLTVFGSPTEASQILINLVLNAADAMAGVEGKITVNTSFEIVDRARPMSVGELRAGHYAILSVTDTAGGIPDDVMPRIFDHAFSTKGAKGTGVGLAMVSTIMTRLRGAIQVSTNTDGPEPGTTFNIFWPVDSQDPKTQEDISSDQQRLDDKLILLVDDEEHVTEVLRSYFERLGAEVSALNDPELALEVILDDPDDWDCIVTDYDMGTMNGGDLIEKVREETDALPIFVVTALSRRLSDPRVTEETVQGVFAKPVNMRLLSQEIAAAIDANGQKEDV